MSKPEKMNPSSVLEKMSTGIAGFDEITRGGLPRGRVTLVVGGPGTGKTVFALQTLVNGARQRREPGIFVAFEENARHIVANAASFGWDLPALAKETLFFLDARISPDIVKAGEFDLAGMLASITAKADAMGAKRIVFDSIAGAFAEAACRRGERVSFVSFDEAGSETKSAEEHVMMIKALSREHQPRCLVIDPLSALAQVGGPSTALGVAQRLLRLTKTEGITVVCTCQIETVDPQGETPVLDVSSIVDTWIHLSYVPHGGERNRALTIVKSRGTKHSNQVRELLIRDKGVTLADVYTAEGRVLMGTARWAKEASERTERERIRMEVEGKRRELMGAEAKVKAQLEVLKHELEARQAELALLVSEQQGREDQETQRTSELRRLRDADKNLPGDAPTKARTKKASRARDSQKDQGGA